MADNFLSNVSATANAVSPFITNLILQGKQRKRDEKRRAEDFLRSDKIRAEDLEAKLAERDAKEKAATLLARRNFFTQRGRNLSTEQRISGREELFEIEPGPQAPQEEVDLKDLMTRVGITGGGDISDLIERGQITIPEIPRSAGSIQKEEKGRLTNLNIKSLIDARDASTELKQKVSDAKSNTQRVRVLNDLERSLGRQQKMLNDPFVSALMDPVELEQELDNIAREIEDVRVQQREIGEVEETPKAPLSSKQKVETDLKTLLDLRDKTPKESFGRMQGNMKKRIGALLTRGELSPEDAKVLLTRLFL